MKALNQEEIKQICELYKKFGNVRDVKRRSTASIGTIHKYLTLNSVISKHNIVKSLSSTDSCLIGAYVGLWMGDGTQYKDRHIYTIKICTNKNDKILNAFVADVIFRIFGKKSYFVVEKNRNSAYIKYHSKFIFDFIHEYATTNGIKTYSVRLKNKLDSLPDNFLRGCLLGLGLSDGFLKKNFVFSVASRGLAMNMQDILMKFGFTPKYRIQNRPNKADAHVVVLGVKESKILGEFLDKTIIEIGYHNKFMGLKYGGPGEI